MPEEKTTNNPPKRKWLPAAAAVAGAAVLALGLKYWLWSRDHEKTDDAFIDAHVETISSQVQGQVVRIYVDDNQEVKKNDPLMDIDPTDYSVKLEQARAELAAAVAQSKKADLDAESYKQLYAKDQVSRQQFQHAMSEADVSRADAELARKKVDAADLDLQHARIAAPEDGRVTRKAVESRNYVQVGQPLMALVPRQVWVTANFKETQLTRMRAGQKASVRVDAYPGRRFSAHVDSIQSGTGSRFSLLPAENATGNFVKIVQRIPVKIAFDDPPESLPPLSPGMSAEPEVELK